MHFNASTLIMYLMFHFSLTNTALLWYSPLFEPFYLLEVACRVLSGILCITHTPLCE